MKSLSVISVSLLAVLAGGCTKTMRLSAYEHAKGYDAPGAQSPWAAYAPGKNVFVDATAACAARLSTEEPSSSSAAAARELPGEVAPESLSLWTVEDARIHGDDGLLALKLKNAKLGSRWIALKGGERASCAYPASSEIAKAFAGEGTTYAFTPWRSTCDELEATGEGIDALLVQSDGGVALAHEGVVLGPRTARQEASASDRTPWIRAFKGAVKIRADVFQDCFTEQNAAGAEPPTDPARLLHVDSDRCLHSKEGGEPHVACTTTVGVWSGIAKNDAVSLQLVRRTLGRVDFLGRKLVSGSRWATTVVSVSTRRGSESTFTELYDVVDREAGAALQSEDDVRVARPDDPDITHGVTIDPQDIVIGEVVTREEQGTSKYKTGERPVPNPAKARAKSAIASAESAVRSAEQGVDSATEKVRSAERGVSEARAEIPRAEEEYRDQQRERQRAIALAAEAKRTCLAACDGFSGAKERSNCKMACEIGGTAGGIALSLGMEPSRDGIEQAKEGVRQAEQRVVEARDGVDRAKRNVLKAKQQVEEARRREREVPETIQEDIMSPWNYVKKIHTRTLTASVVFTVRHPDGREEKKALPVRTEWTDYDVAPDPAHNVVPHVADRRVLEQPAASVPLLASVIGRRVGDEMRLVLNAAERDLMKSALARAKVASEPDYELVDATAYATAGPRIARVARRGAVQLGTSAFRVPIVGVPLGADECLLAIASADPTGPSEGKLEMLAVGGAFGDVRRGPRPAVEICSSELPPGRSIDEVVLKSERPEKVHWTLFITRAEPPAKATPKKDDDGEPTEKAAVKEVSAK